MDILMRKSIILLFIAFLVTSCAAHSHYAEKFPLHQAAYDGETQYVQSMINSGVPIDEPDSNGFTPLLAAAYYGNWETAKLLVESGVNVNAQDPNGMTALYYAVSYDQPTMARYLIGNGANINVRDTSWGSLLATSSANAHWDISKLLVEFGVDINTADASNMTPLLYSASYCEPDIAEFFVNNGAQVNDRDSQGQTALHLIAYGCIEQPDKASKLIDILSVNGLDINTVDSEGHSAYWKAMEYRLTNMVAVFRQKGVTERFGGGVPVDLKTMAAEDCTYIVDGERSAGAPMWILGPIGYGAAWLSDQVKIPKKYRECMVKMGFDTIEQ